MRVSADTPTLTLREREIAVLAAAGRTSPDIARTLRISVRTVDNHLGRVYVKLGLGGRADLPAVFGPARLPRAPAEVDGGSS